MDRTASHQPPATPPRSERRPVRTRTPKASGHAKPDPQTAGPHLDADANDESELFALLGIASPPAPQSTTKPEASPSVPEPPLQPSTPTPGLLAVSKRDRQRSSQRSTTRDDSTAAATRESGSGSPRSTRGKAASRNNRQKELAQGEDTATGSASEGDVPRGARRSRKKKTDQPVKVADEALAAHGSNPTQPMAMPGGAAKSRLGRNGGLDDATGITQSLPADGAFAGGGLSKTKRSTKRRDAAQIPEPGSEWDMPTEVGPDANNQLTWQQQLASYPNLEHTPGKKSGKSAVPKKGFAAADKQASSGTPAPQPKSNKPKQSKQPTSALSASLMRPQDFGLGLPDERPGQTRRRSLDAIPPHIKAAQYDLMPYHSGMNVHRAPQTPMRVNGGDSNTQPNMGWNPSAPLPLVPGEYPRLKSGDNISNGHVLVNDGTPKYAGPRVHNSPHARNLVKPDLDDF